MTNRIDLTRWNRASLKKFRYIDGNAVSYLELIRQELVERYKDPETEKCEWISPNIKTPENEIADDSATLVEKQKAFSNRQDRIVASYQQDRRDWLWEMSRTFARACHVLTEHMDTYANEGYLGTATQWDNVRRLVEMLDYHPAPPASAYTPLVFNAKTSDRVINDNQLIIDKGFQVKYTPPNGGDKIIYETLYDLQLEPKINALRPKDWDKSQSSNIDDSSETTTTTEFSFLAEQEIIHIQGVGNVHALEFHALVAPQKYLIKDLIALDPEDTALTINESQLWELKAKAEVICFFEPIGDWSKVNELFLYEIMDFSIDYLVEFTGNTEEDTEQFKLELEILKLCLDNPFFQTLKLNQVTFPPQLVPGAFKTFWKAPKKPKLKIDSVAMVCQVDDLLESTTIDEAQAVWISEVEKQSKQVHLTPSATQNSWQDWKQGESILKVASDWRRKPWLNGENVIRTTEAHGFSAGEYIGWLDASDWQYALIKKTDNRSLYIEFDGELPEKDILLYRLLQTNEEQFPADFQAIAIINQDGNDLAPIVEPVSPTLPPSPSLPFTVVPVPLGSASSGLLPPASLPGIGSFLFPSPFLPIDLVKAAVELLLSLGIMIIPSTGEPVIKGLPPEGPLSSATDLLTFAGDLVTMLNQLETPDGFPMILWDDGLSGPAADSIHASQIQSLLENLLDNPLTVSFNQVTQDLSDDDLGPLLVRSIGSLHSAVVDSSQPNFLFNGKPDKVEPGDWVVAEYEEDIRAYSIAAIDATNDEYFAVEFEDYSSVSGELKAIHANFVDAELAELANFNSEVIDGSEVELEENVEGLLKAGQEVLLTAEGKTATLATIEKVESNTITTIPPATDYSKGELVIRGNMVLAGHGESKPSKILGSGNATLSNQSFVLKVVDVSFIPDATKPAGVAAAIDVNVAGEIWEQVASLKDSQAEDHHYEVRMTEEGFIKIIFGDGLNGRRLPTGKNNLRVSYRVGTGSYGILPENVLVTPVKQNALVESILQPEAAAGGGDMESIESLRTSAPSTLLALQRAVSLTDFEHLASSQSSIWQASAENVVLNSGREECVFVHVVPVNGVMTPTIKNQIETFLQNHALPTVIVKVGEFKPITFDLDITVRVNSAAFNFDDVIRAVTDLITESLALKNRRLGEGFYLSEVYNLVDSVEGVENSVCLLDGVAGQQVVEANGVDCVAYLNEAGLVVRAEEYSI